MAIPTLVSVPEQIRRAKVRARLYRTYPQVAETGSFSPNGIKVEQAVEVLIDIARRPGGAGAEPYLAEVMIRICPACPNRDLNGSCPMRTDGRCQLFGNVEQVMETIRWALAAADQSFENQPFDCHGYRHRAAADQ